MESREVDELVERITERVLRELQQEGPGVQWCVDPLNGTRFRCQRPRPDALLREAPDRIGALFFEGDPDAARVFEAAGSRDLGAAIARLIDHTLLKPDATPDDIEKLCHEAVRFGFKSVCVSPIYARLACQIVGNSGVIVCAVVGFPLGANLSAIKAAETRRAIEDGASEIDMVLPIGMLKAGRHSYVAHDIHEVVQAASPKVVKVILETCLLENDEKIIACRIAREAGAAFVKTSTGFSSGGATAEDVRLMRMEVGGGLGVKASGGIRNLEDAVRMVKAGASRLGASASVAIASEEVATPAAY